MNLRPALDGQRFDVTVIGGGINGVAIARECARAGRRTLLVEQHDFGSGTTSRSTRIIHGGLRYLEYGDIAQVRESLRERQYLTREYPYLVRPLEFLLALDKGSGRSALAVRAGLWLYRKMGGRRRRGDFGGEAQDGLQRLLDAGRRFAVFSFEDAQCEFPERLVAEWLVEATEAGCSARNHTQVLAVEMGNGRATSVRLRDQLSGKEERVESNWIVNATGPWADQVCRSSGIHTVDPMVGGVRGSHIVLPKFPGAPEAAVYTEAVDRRPIFVIPWNGQLLVGTTEVADAGDPGRVQPSGDEIQYLLQSLHRVFPQVRFASSDIHYAFAGVRPLPYRPKSNPSAIERKHYFHDHTLEGAAGMISVIGGKLTTAGSVARECAARIGCAAVTLTTAIVAADADVDAVMAGWIAGVAEFGGISQESARGMVEWQGPRALDIARKARERPELAERLCPHTPHIVAEALDAFERQCAVTLGDVLLRRVPVALGACWSPECARVAAERVGTAMGWDDRRTVGELECLEAECAAFLRRPETAQGCGT
jgi:glycerol-3-phosphate dehydrogenase